MKKEPIRMCIACRSEVPKKQMIRIVKNKEGEIFIDRTGKAQGRGAYICDNLECIEKCIKQRALNRTFSMEIDKEIYEKLKGDYLAKK